MGQVIRAMRGVRMASFSCKPNISRTGAIISYYDTLGDALHQKSDKKVAFKGCDC
jgi:hypothetical protein